MTEEIYTNDEEMIESDTPETQEEVIYPYEFEDEQGKWRQISKYSKILIETSEVYDEERKPIEDAWVKIDPPPSKEERISALEEQRIQADDTAIELYEQTLALQETTARQDDAIIELYEMIGG